MKVAIIGSRSVSETFYSELSAQIPHGTTTILSGGSEGADMLAKRYAEENHLAYVEILPDYQTFGRAAPLRRNEEIVQRADHVLALWDGHSRGTAYVIRYCLETGTSVHVLICH